MRLPAAITTAHGWFVAQCLELDVASTGLSVEEACATVAEVAPTPYFEHQDVEIGDAQNIAPIEISA